MATLVNSGIKDPDEANQMVDGQNNNAVQGMQTQTKGDSIDQGVTMEQAKELMAELQKVIHDNEKKSSD